MNLRNDNIYTVSRLNAEVRLLLENEMGIVWLVGEISNLMVPVSGHWYFTLKDGQAQVKCAMFKGNNRRVTFKPANGNQVLVRARLSLYERAVTTKSSWKACNPKVMAACNSSLNN